MYTYINPYKDIYTNVFYSIYLSDATVSMTNNIKKNIIFKNIKTCLSFFFFCHNLLYCILILCYFAKTVTKRKLFSSH